MGELDAESKFQSTRIFIESGRWAHPNDAAAKKRLMPRLQARFQGILLQKGISDREVRMRLTSALVGRKIASFNELQCGEVIAMLDDEDLREVLHYLIEKDSANEVG